MVTSQIASYCSIPFFFHVQRHGYSFATVLLQLAAVVCLYCYSCHPRSLDSAGNGDLWPGPIVARDNRV